jgi:hypothetical protein
VTPLREFDDLGKQGMLGETARLFPFRDWSITLCGHLFLDHVRHGSNHRLSAAVGCWTAMRLVRHMSASQAMKQIRVLHRHGNRLLRVDANAAPQATNCSFLNGSLQNTINRVGFNPGMGRWSHCRR